MEKILTTTESSTSSASANNIIDDYKSSCEIKVGKLLAEIAAGNPSGTYRDDKGIDRTLPLTKEDIIQHIRLFFQCRTERDHECFHATSQEGTEEDNDYDSIQAQLSRQFRSIVQFYYKPTSSNNSTKVTLRDQITLQYYISILCPSCFTLLANEKEQISKKGKESKDKARVKRIKTDINQNQTSTTSTSHTYYIVTNGLNNSIVSKRPVYNINNDNDTDSDLLQIGTITTANDPSTDIGEGSCYIHIDNNTTIRPVERIANNRIAYLNPFTKRSNTRIFVKEIEENDQLYEIFKIEISLDLHTTCISTPSSQHAYRELGVPTDISEAELYKETWGSLPDLIRQQKQQQNRHLETTDGTSESPINIDD